MSPFRQRRRAIAHLVVSPAGLEFIRSKPQRSKNQKRFDHLRDFAMRSTGLLEQDVP